MYKKIGCVCVDDFEGILNTIFVTKTKEFVDKSYDLCDKDETKLG